MSYVFKIKLFLKPVSVRVFQVNFHIEVLNGHCCMQILFLLLKGNSEQLSTKKELDSSFLLVFSSRKLHFVNGTTSETIIKQPPVM